MKRADSVGVRASAILALLGLFVGTAFGNAFTFIDAEATNGPIRRLVLTPHGTPWVITETPGASRSGLSIYHLLFWDGARFMTPTPAVNVTGMPFAAAFFGGSDRDAWFTMLKKPEGTGPGILLKLGEGRIEKEDVFNNAIPRREPCIYVARDGRLFNWGESFLSQRKTDGTWSRIEATLPANDYWAHPLIFERDGSVFFFVSPMLYVADPDGTVTGRSVAGAPDDRNATAQRWGRDRIVVWSDAYRAKAFAFDVTSLQPVAFPASPPGVILQNRQAYSTRGEALWLCGWDQSDQHRETTRFLLCLPDGSSQFERVPHLSFHEAHNAFGVVKTQLECADGTFVSGLDGLAMIAPRALDNAERYDWKYGLSGTASDLQEDHTRERLWFVMNGQAVNFNRRFVPERVVSATCWEEIPILPESGLFQPSAEEIACFAKDGSSLMRWNGFGWRNQQVPFDPKTSYLHGTDDRGAIWVGDGTMWHKIDAKNVQTEERARLSYRNFGQAPWSPREPVVSGGWFVYPFRDRGHFMGGDPARVFENHTFPARAYGTPFDGHYVLRMCEDAAGDLWFLTSHPSQLRTFQTPVGEAGLRSERGRLFRYALSGQRLTCAQPLPDVCGRQLSVATLLGATQRQRVLLVRIDECPWARMRDGEASAVFRFASNGVYRCEMIAFEYGGRVPGTVSFTVHAQVALPDTRRTDVVGAEPIRVLARTWQLPVSAVPSSRESAARIMWRPVGAAEWHLLDPDGQLDLLDLKWGLQTLEFAAEEDGFWRDTTPLRLDVDVAISLQDYLVVLSDALKSRDPSTCDRAARALAACGPEANALLDQLSESNRRLDKIRAALRMLGDASPEQ